MSTAAPGGMDAKAFLEELKTNRKTQAATGIFVVVAGACAYLIFAPDTPKKKAPRPAAGSPAAVALDARQSQALKSLPDLARLGKAGSPGEDKMRRDLFLFDGPPPPPPPAAASAASAPPPTPEELAAEAERAARRTEELQKPQGIRYLGFLSSRASGPLAAFMKGEEPVTMRIGELANSRWRLVEITEKAAIFQNVKYADMRHALEARDGAGASSGFGNQTVTNEF